MPSPNVPDLADVLIDIEVVRLKLGELTEKVSLAVPETRRAYTVRLIAMLADGVELVDDLAAGR
jgi:hypothetical protein